MTFIHYARCKTICSLLWLIIRLHPTARDLLRICGGCPHLKPIRKDKK